MSRFSVSRRLSKIYLWPTSSEGVNFHSFLFGAPAEELMYNSEHVPSLAMNYGAGRNNKFMYSNMVDVISLRQLLPGLLGLQEG